jgi:hypothetical protein
MIELNLKRLPGLPRCFCRPRSRIAVARILVIASAFQSLPDDFAAVLVFSLTGLDVSLWLVSKGWLAVLA